MKNRSALKIALIFLFAYSFFSLFGTVFFTGWAKPSILKSIVVWFYKFPIDWIDLMVNVSYWFLLINIAFWSVLVYVLALIIIKLTIQIRS